MIAILLAEGFEEIEALTPLDILRRAGLDVVTVGVTGKEVTGSHGIKVTADALPDEIDLGTVDTAIFPGGMPGADNLDKAEITDKIIDAVRARGGRLAAICAAPLIFGRRGLLQGRRAVCYPGFESNLIGAEVLTDGVVTDGYITTARGMGVALDFSLELVRLLAGAEISEKITRAIMMTAPYEAKVFEEKTPIDAFLTDDLSDTDSRLDVAERAAAIYECAEELEISLRLDTAERGPRLTRYRLATDKNVGCSLRKKLADAISLKLGTEITVEKSENNVLSLLIENKSPISVGMKEALSAKEFSFASSPLTLYLGRSIVGDPIYQNLTRMPHLLITGDNKGEVEQALDAMALSILTKAHQSDARLLMLGGEALFNKYRGLPALISAPLYDEEKALAALSKLIEIMEERYEIFKNCGTYNIKEYNAIRENDTDKLPYIVALVFGMPGSGSAHAHKLEEALVILLQKSRAAGIHVILGGITQEISKLTPTLLSNLPSRIYLKAEQRLIKKLAGEAVDTELLGNGDALYRHIASDGYGRIQMPRITSSEATGFVTIMKRRLEASSDYKIEDAGSEDNTADGDIILRAVDALVEASSAKADTICDALSVSRDVAEATLSALQEIGLVSEEDENGARELLLNTEEWAIMRKRIKGEAT